MTALLVCQIQTLYQLFLPQCPVLEFGSNEQLLFMELLQQVQVSQDHNECLSLLYELSRERQERREPRNIRHVLELRCLFHIQLKLKLQKLKQRRKHSEDKLQKLEESNALDMEEAEERIGNFIEYLNRTGIEITKSSPIPVLHWAAAYGSPLLVTKLISAGASLHLRDLSHGTPLHSAALNGQFQVVKLLMQLGSDVNARNLYGFTALHYAVMSGCVKTTMTLLEDDNGIEIDAKSQNGYTPLYAAAHNGRLTIVQMLLKHGADINNRDEDGNSALITAADTGHVDVVCWLMQNIKHINTKPNIANDTPLNVAARDGNIETVRCLLENGFPANEPEDVTSSLAVAVEKGNLEVVKLLLKFGAEVNRKDKDGTTQLHKAVEKGNFKIVQVLIQHGADLLAVDKDGRTAEGIARRKKYHHIEEFLTNVRRNGGSNIKSSGNEDLD